MSAVCLFFRKVTYNELAFDTKFGLFTVTSSDLHLTFTLCSNCSGSYFCYDNPAALQDQMKEDLEITTGQFMNFYAWYLIFLSIYNEWRFKLFVCCRDLLTEFYLFNSFKLPFPLSFIQHKKFKTLIIHIAI